jgi:hypothetical protein
MSSIILSIPSSLPAGKTCPSATAVAPITATNDPNFFADNSASPLRWLRPLICQSIFGKKRVWSVKRAAWPSEDDRPAWPLM